MKNKLVFVIYLMAISCQIVLAESAAGGGYFYNQPKIPQIFEVSQIRSQELNLPPQQQQSNALVTYNFQKGQNNLPNYQNPANFALQQPSFNQPSALNFQQPNQPQLNNINYSPSQQQQFNSQAENIMRFQFEVMNGNQGNSIEQGCNPEPIIGQFKPELVDLANGGPLTRVITTCGPDTNCKSIALQSDLNRVLAVLPRRQTNNQNNRQPQQGSRGFNIEGRGNNAGRFINDDGLNSLVRPPNRRLIPYTEILQDDIYN